MNGGDTLTTSILDLYGTAALLVGHTVLGALTLVIVGGAGWVAFIRGRRWFLDFRTKAAARRAGWRPDEDGWQWTSPDGSTTVREVVLPGSWTIYRGSSYSVNEHPLHRALQYAMRPADLVPWVKMEKQ